MKSSAVHASNAGNSVPGKIIIKGTSKLSLKDRFARLSSEAQQQQAILHSNETAISAANKRLAQDLGNHPEVVAALNFQRKSVMQRLGVKARLGLQQRGFQQRSPGFRSFRGRYKNVGQFGYFNNGFRRPRTFGPKRMDGNRIGAFSGFGFGRGAFRKRFRGGNWNYGRGGRGGKQNDRLSREELDRQLDEYMSKTRTHLDNDLDVYMGETVVG